MKIKIRKATIKDFKLFQNFNSKLFQYDKKHDSALDLNWPNKKAGIDYYKSVLKSKNSVCFIAEDENRKTLGKANRFYVCGYYGDKKAVSFYRKNKFIPLDLGLEMNLE